MPVYLAVFHRIYQYIKILSAICEKHLLKILFLYGVVSLRLKIHNISDIIRELK